MAHERAPLTHTCMWVVGYKTCGGCFTLDPPQGVVCHVCNDILPQTLLLTHTCTTMTITSAPQPSSLSTPSSSFINPSNINHRITDLRYRRLLGRGSRTHISVG